MLGDNPNPSKTPMEELKESPREYVSLISEEEITLIKDLNRTMHKLITTFNKRMAKDIPDFKKEDKEHLYPRIQGILFAMALDDLLSALGIVKSVHSMSGKVIDKLAEENGKNLEDFETHLMMCVLYKKMKR